MVSFQPNDFQVNMVDGSVRETQYSRGRSLHDVIEMQDHELRDKKRTISLLNDELWKLRMNIVPSCFSEEIPQKDNIKNIIGHFYKRH